MTPERKAQLEAMFWSNPSSTPTQSNAAITHNEPQTQASFSNTLGAIVEEAVQSVTKDALLRAKIKSATEQLRQAAQFVGWIKKERKHLKRAVKHANFAAQPELGERLAVTNKHLKVAKKAVKSARSRVKRANFKFQRSLNGPHLIVGETGQKETDTVRTGGKPDSTLRPGRKSRGKLQDWQPNERYVPTYTNPGRQDLPKSTLRPAIAKLHQDYLSNTVDARQKESARIRASRDADRKSWNRGGKAVNTRESDLKATRYGLAYA